METGDQGGGANASISFSVFGVLFAHEHHPESTKKLEKSFENDCFTRGKHSVLPSDLHGFHCGDNPQTCYNENLETLILIYICFGHKRF